MDIFGGSFFCLSFIVLYYLIFSIAPLGRGFYFHFAEEESVAQRNEVDKSNLASKFQMKI